MSSTPLPPLAFGENQARHATDPDQAAALAAGALGRIEIYESASRETRFRHKMSTIRVNGLELSAAASTPMRLGIKTPDDTFLLVPFFGATTLRIGPRQYQWGAARRALLLFNCDYRYGITQTRSVLIARIDSARLRATLSAMRGAARADDVECCAEEARLLDLECRSINFVAAFRHLCNYIDALGANPALLERIGVDDWFYRQLACWLAPDLVAEDAGDHGRAAGFTPGAIDAVCEAMRNRLNRPLTKTEMEKISGLSARGLQYAFLRKFGCSPMAWQRRERLNIAHERLSRDRDAASITELSFDLGFSSASRFAAYYKSLFGESPQETRKRRRSNATRHP
ncbi:helix-turn-helix domain-containing protein [Methylocystis sp. IM3]|uniref:AraC family transcriptional regulator n=1 Tax=unclassified Methylocystis TaxID=2625913 RepID=UPI00311A63B9